MLATLHTFGHNNLDGMTLILAPKYGQSLLGHAGNTGGGRLHASRDCQYKSAP